MRTTLLLPLVLLSACDRDDPADDDEIDTDETDGPADTELRETDLGGVCGDGVVDEGEACDFGEANGPQGNCLETCDLARHQRWTVSLGALPGLFDAVAVTADDAPFGTGAWKTSDTDLNFDGLVKFQLNVPLYDARSELPAGGSFPWPDLEHLGEGDLFGTVRLSDLADVRFRTKHPEGEQPAYYLYLYTQPDGVDDDASWYGRRLLAYTREAANSGPAPDTWTTWSLITFQNQLLFWDPGASGLETGPGQTLANLLSTTEWNWRNVAPTAAVTSIDYGAEAVKFVSIQTASGSGTIGVEGLVDAVEVVLRDGRTFTLDLEP